MIDKDIATELNELKKRISVLEELNELRKHIDELEKELLIHRTQYYRYYPPVIWPSSVEPTITWGTITTGDSTIVVSRDEYSNGQK